mmetsp:Transcript_10259/g.26891  ORF Transcript_10259/g.26891 Transcript_10259/m.26891 type:complete len:81 (+) Transcript_10259:1072-1314(+)
MQVDLIRCDVSSLYERRQKELEETGVDSWQASFSGIDPPDSDGDSDSDAIKRGNGQERRGGRGGRGRGSSARRGGGRGKR